jgi:anthranilate phosphoribosyltransferase
VPVLVHGVARCGGGGTAEVFEALGVLPAADRARRRRPCRRASGLITIDTMAPKLAYLLSLRRVLGVRNSTHTLVKIMQPFAGPALRLVSYTHPESGNAGRVLHHRPCRRRGDAFLMRGTEGETVANANKAQQIDWFHGGLRTTWCPSRRWSANCRCCRPTRCCHHGGVDQGRAGGRGPVPPPIAEQVAQCLLVSRTLHSRQRM